MCRNGLIKNRSYIQADAIIASYFAWVKDFFSNHRYLAGLVKQHLANVEINRLRKVGRFRKGSGGLFFCLIVGLFVIKQLATEDPYIIGCFNAQLNLSRADVENGDFDILVNADGLTDFTSQY